jgi:hypothetical protein
MVYTSKVQANERFNYITLHFTKMEDDTQLMYARAEEILFLFKKKHENKLEDGLAKEKVKVLAFGFMVRATESWKNELFNRSKCESASEK